MRSNRRRTELGFEDTKEKALNLLGYRAHSCKELYDKLIRSSDSETAGEVIAFLSENGILDDDVFAYEFAHDEIELKYFGRKRIIMDLIARGIKKDAAEYAVEKAESEFYGSGNNEEEIIRYLIENRFQHCFTEKNGRGKIISGLMRMGYGYEMIKEILAYYDFEFEEEDYGF